ncbi:MAG: hypothetical protein II973_12270 [Spirochaetaceae bacterium]|nr:hypothetical protein [Spirochaetaceae bacterium]
MKRTFISIIAIIALFAQTAMAQTQTSALNGATVSIKFYDKTMYYPGNSPDNPVYVKVTIANTSSETVRFKLADDRMFSLDFTGYTVKNSQLEHTSTFIRKRSTNQTVFFREIALEAGEEYSFVENLKDYLVIPEPAIYYVELKFYPELYRTQLASVKEKTSNAVPATFVVYKNDFVVTNRLTLEIKPSPSAASVVALPLTAGTKEILKPQPISPDKVVEQTIIARQKSLWDQYFLYLDVEELYIQDGTRKRKYNAESADMRVRMLENYKLDLRQVRIDRDIVAIPVSFEIEKTMYSATEGTVTVKEWFQNDNFKEIKRYTYYVRQRDGIWQIYNYSVENLGTE